MKSPTAAQKRRFSEIAELGCVICGSPAQIHHCSTYMGGGRNHDKVIPLCPNHHTSGGYGVAIHAGKAKFEELFGTEEELLKQIENR